MAALLETLTAAAAVVLAGALRRAAASVIGLLSSVALLLISLAFFTLAGYRALAEAIGSIYAPLVVGTAYLFLALVGLLIVQARRRS
jgi:hypothetical protein